MLEAPRKLPHNSESFPNKRALFDELGNLRQKLVNFLITLTFSDEVEQRYWKQQISGTLVAYTDKTIFDLHENFYNKLTLEENQSTFGITAYWLMQLIKGNALPNDVNDEVAMLHRMLNRPGSILNENPTGKSNEIVIANQNVTSLANAISKTAMLRYIAENFDAIFAFIQNNSRMVRLKFPDLLLLNDQWLNIEVAKIKSKVEHPHDFIKPQHVAYTFAANKRTFDELEELFLTLNQNVNSTIQRSKSLSKHLSKKRILNKKQTQSSDHFVKPLEKIIIPKIPKVTFDKKEGWKNPLMITLGSLALSIWIFSLPISIGLSIGVGLLTMAFNNVFAINNQNDQSKMMRQESNKPEYENVTRNILYARMKPEKKINEKVLNEPQKMRSNIKQICR